MGSGDRKFDWKFQSWNMHEPSLNNWHCGDWCRQERKRDKGERGRWWAHNSKQEGGHGCRKWDVGDFRDTPFCVDLKLCLRFNGALHWPICMLKLSDRIQQYCKDIVFYFFIYWGGLFVGDNNIGGLHYITLQTGCLSY